MTSYKKSRRDHAGRTSDPNEFINLPLPNVSDASMQTHVNCRAAVYRAAIAIRDEQRTALTTVGDVVPSHKSALPVKKESFEHVTSGGDGNRIVTKAPSKGNLNCKSVICLFNNLNKFADTSSSQATVISSAENQRRLQQQKQTPDESQPSQSTPSTQSAPAKITNDTNNNNIPSKPNENQIVNPLIDDFLVPSYRKEQKRVQQMRVQREQTESEQRKLYAQYVLKWERERQALEAAQVAAQREIERQARIISTQEQRQMVDQRAFMQAHVRARWHPDVPSALLRQRELPDEAGLSGKQTQDDVAEQPCTQNENVGAHIAVSECKQTDESRFPFKPTSSGNLKVNAKQVVYETNRISVLVNDPVTTHVKILDKSNYCEPPTPDIMNRDDFPKSSAINALIKQNSTLQQGIGSSLGSLLMGRFPDAPVRKEKESLEYENKATHEILEPELNLSRLGYSSSDSIEWTAVVLPEKKNLYLELYARITNFTNADCKVYIDNEEFNCHLLVLQCYSEVFHTYVAVKKVELPSDKCSPSAFAFIYEWMITGDPSYRELNRSNVLEIFNAAKYLKIKDLIEQCWAFIDNPKVFTEDTAFLLYTDAKAKNLPEVRDLMLPRIEHFFLMLVSSEDWLRLNVDDVQAFLSSNYICVNCEMEVFMSAVRWLKHDWESRDKFKLQVLGCVRFGNVAPWQLVDIKRNPENPEFRDLAKEPEICKMVDDGLAFVIIKYWYGQQNEDYNHWNSILALKEPASRNWSGTEKTYFTYREFLIYLDVYRRQLMMAKNKDEKKAMLAEASPSQASRDAVGANMRVPTMEEFIRGSVSQNAPKKQPQNRISPQFYLPPHAYNMANIPSINPLPHSRTKQMTKRDAVAVIERAYLAYRLRSNVPGLARRLHKLRKRDSGVFNRLFNPRTTSRPNNHGKSRQHHKPLTSRQQHFETKHQQNIAAIGQQQQQQQQCVMRVELPIPTIVPDERQHAAYRQREYVCDGSLYHMEHESVLVFGGINVHTKYGSGRNTGKDIYRYMPVQNDWEFVGEMPAPRTHHGVAYLMGRIYVVGGSDPREDDIKGKFVVVDSVWSYDPVKRTWFSEGGLNMRRKNFGLVVVGQYMYAIGGQDKNSRVTDTMERYDPVKGVWEYVASMRHPRMGVACVKFDEKIWVGGGMCGSSQRPLSDFVECYDVLTNQWTEMTRLRVPRCFGTFAAMSNNLYIIAGAGRSRSLENNTVSFSSVDIWNKETQSWEEHAQMEVARHGHTTAYLGTQILIIGGVTTVYMRSLSSIECFCTTRGTWIRGMSSLPNCLTGHATCTLPPAMCL